jgi:hypothetical protein
MAPSRRTFSSRRFRSPYRSRGGNTGLFVAVAAGLAFAAAGAHTAAKAHPHASAKPARVTSSVTAGTGETAFWTAALADLGAPATAANIRSLTDWADREGPWGSVGQFNPLDTILTEPGSWAFNTFDGDLHVQSYPTATEGAQATAATLVNGYPAITAALREGIGLCGDTATEDELSEWSGGGYEEVC